VLTARRGPDANSREYRALLQERVVLVDRADRAIGASSKLVAHQRGQLHRAFSVLVLNTDGNLLLQRRAATKYHSGGLWSNTCCGHPRPGEVTVAAASRRLAEELNVPCRLSRLFSFRYRAELPGGMREHELDHVFVGQSDIHPVPDPAEVSEWRYAPLAALRSEMASTPTRFTVWFHILVRQLCVLQLDASRFHLPAEHRHASA
jgi:isopentenyl-diphosphate Delta-isomerase